MRTIGSSVAIIDYTRTILYIIIILIKTVIKLVINTIISNNTRGILKFYIFKIYLFVYNT